MSARRYRVHKDDLVVIGGRQLRLDEATKGGFVFDVVGEPGVKATFTWAEFAREVGRKGYRRVPDRFVEGRARAESEAGVARLNDIPKREVEALMERLRWTTGLLCLEQAGLASRSDTSMASAIVRIADDIQAERVKQASNGAAKSRKTQFNSKPGPGAPDQPVNRPSVKTLLRWVKRYERGGRTALALRYGHHRSGNRARRIEPAMVAIVRAAARGYMSAQRPTKATCLRAMKTAARKLNETRAAQGLGPLRCPTRSILYAEIEALPKAMVCAARLGPDEAKSQFGPLGAGCDVQRPGQRIEMDEWEVHALTLLDQAKLLERLDAQWRETAERHRLVVCEAIDATGLTLGLSFAGHPNTTANAMACLAMVMSDKTALAKWAGATSRWDMCCSPEEVVTDGGAGFASAEFRCAVTDLLGDSAITPAGVAPLRARIERNFLTKEQRLMPLVPGRTFLNPVDKGDYDSHARAAILDVVLRRLVIIDAVDVCANSPNTGRLRGATPLDKWDELCGIFGIYPPPGAEDRRNALGCKVERLTGRHGVRVLNLDYTSDELERLFRDQGARTLTVSVDPADLGEVSVFTDDGWLSCGCVQHDMAGVSLDVWAAAEADLRRRNQARAELAEPTVLDAIERMRELVASAEAQFGLGGACPSAKELDRIESMMLISFPPRIADPDHVERDLLASAVPRGTPVEPYAVMGGDASAAPEDGTVSPAHHEILDDDEADGRAGGWLPHGDELVLEADGEGLANDDRAHEAPDAAPTTGPTPSATDDFTPGIEEYDDDFDPL